MKDSYQDINAGDSSTNNQAGRDINNYGISYSDAKYIAIDAFEANAYRIGEIAAATASSRVRELMDDVFRRLESLEKEIPGIINKIQEPDVQYGLVSAQMQYARSGSKSTLELLSELIVNRFKVSEESLQSKVLNECIDVLPKITVDQIKMITVLFLVKECKDKSVRILIEKLYKLMPDDMIAYLVNSGFFEHLMYTGITTNDVTTLNGQQLEYLIRLNYEPELTQKVSGSTLDALNPPVTKQFVIDPISNRVFDNWNKSPLKNYKLTSVGKAIAIINYNSTFNTNMPLDNWIKG